MTIELMAAHRKRQRREQRQAEARAKKARLEAELRLLEKQMVAADHDNDTPMLAVLVKYRAETERKLLRLSK